MQNRLAVLDTMPNQNDFYRLYWNRQPFVVTAALSPEIMKGLISVDELAGLAMEETAQSRIVRTALDDTDWSCSFGPFGEDKFAALGDANWSLLVQNVEQFHPDTASLLRHFNLSPRWMLDDIMVSYSTPGGSVGPHLDSYHVFLVQGQGRRTWKISLQKILEETYLDHPDLKILAEPFDGDSIEVGIGDVLYVPPHFGHQGTTSESSLTFSIGFLGPKISELMGSYGQYLAKHETLDHRYTGDGMGSDSAGFSLGPSVVDDVRQCLTLPANSEDFRRWLVEYFTQASHPDFGDYAEREHPLSLKSFAAMLEGGSLLIKPPYLKFAITASVSGGFLLGVDQRSFALDEKMLPIVQALMTEQAVSSAIHSKSIDGTNGLEFLLDLYNHQVLEFVED